MRRPGLRFIGEILIERGLIKLEQLDKALKIQKDKGGLIGEILVDTNVISEDDIVQALAAQYGFPYLPLHDYDIDLSISKSVPEHIANYYCLIAVDKIENTITVAMADPLNSNAVEDVEYTTGCKAQPFIAKASEIRSMIKKCYAS
ncbi:MAG: hypothetical protein HY589_05505 [Candidatus Omnitrophica bacterium]|nr:hypothetical protein [Candidatus Omnitrophota bacterium]